VSAASDAVSQNLETAIIFFAQQFIGLKGIFSG
jgi:hypothetical protein